MSSSTGKSPTQRVPAWKRLGLKLRPASDDDTHHATTAGATTSTMSNSQTHLNGSTPNGKRRASGGPPASDNSAKRAKQDHNTPSHQGPKKAKSVSFTADTADPPRGKTKQSNSTKGNKGTKGTGNANSTTAPAKRARGTAPVNLEPALAYLRTWHTARESWKFNKNHQTKLLEHVFADASGTTIPAVDIDVFYEYIKGLQGGVRARLRELARGIQEQDMEQGAAGFPGTAADAVDRRQRDYEDVVGKFLSQAPTPGKRRFAEVDYVLRTTDMEMQRRVVKRMRAEVVLDELGEATESPTATIAAKTATSTDTGKNHGNLAAATDDNTRLQLNDGPQQRTKRKRKVRTAAVEDSSSDSSSSSEDESDSDTSSSGDSGNDSDGSSSDDSDSDGDEGGKTAKDDDDSSSSSSSSSSGSESDSDDE
ncbi:hypothetical protein GGR50DRAFT_691348 [Xylaria sp. CBS 124048]|nr:hypothetical protein GGR50DRAFT_691348 [Xylaria sp. CBS 124048]